MSLKKLQQSLASVLRGEPKEAAVSRRDLLAGFGLAGFFAVAGPALFASGEAEAQPSPQRRGPPRGPGRRRGPPGRGRGRGRGQRFRHGDLVRRCRRERRFRRRNPNLCRQALAMRRPGRGACIQIGPFQICD